METILNKEVIPVNKQKTASRCLHQYAEAASWVKLKWIPMKYQVFINQMCVNTVFMYKKSLFLTIGYRREKDMMDCRWFTSCCGILLFRDTVGKPTVKLGWTPVLQLKDIRIKLH